MNATIPLAPESYTTNRRPVAPLWHTVGLLLFLALITYGGVRTHKQERRSLAGPAIRMATISES